MAIYRPSSARAALFAAALTLAPLSLGGAQEAISQAKLEAFVIAAVEINRLIDQWGPVIDSAESEEKAESLKREAEAELIAAIERTEGITREEYRAIVGEARRDPNLAARIRQTFDDMRGQ